VIPGRTYSSLVRAVLPRVTPKTLGHWVSASVAGTSDTEATGAFSNRLMNVGRGEWPNVNACHLAGISSLSESQRIHLRDVTPR